MIPVPALNDSGFEVAIGYQTNSNHYVALTWAYTAP